MPASRTPRNRGHKRGLESISAQAEERHVPSGSYIGRSPSALRQISSHRAGPSRPTEYIGRNPNDLKKLTWASLTSTGSSVRSSSPELQNIEDQQSYAGDYDVDASEDEQPQEEPLPSEEDEGSSSADVATSSAYTVETLPQTYYEAYSDEEEESENYVVAKETPPEDADDPDAIPVRVLSDFFIYDIDDCCRLVPFSAEIGTDDLRKYGASGYVAPWTGSESDGEDDGSSEGDNVTRTQRISLQRIQEVSVHWAEKWKTKLILDPKIYLKTEYAWYILDVPAENYRPFYAPFWTKHFIFHQLITSAMNDLNRPLSYEEFIKELEDEEAPSAIIGNKLTIRDVERHSTHAYVVSAFEGLKRSYKHPMMRIEDVPAIKEIRRPRSATKPQPKSKNQAAKPSTKRKFPPTVVTPRLHDLYQGLFPLNKFEACGPPVRDEMSAEIEEDHPVHRGNPQSVKWVKESKIKAHYYREIIIDGVTYTIGDTVIVEPGDDENKKRAAVSEKVEGVNNNWYAKICYFFDNEVNGEKMFHAHWYEHGSQTILQEVAHSKSLYLIDECGDQYVESILQKCDVRVLEDTEDEPMAQDCGFFTGLVWDRENTVFFQRREEEIRQALKECPPERPCVSCGIDLLDEQRIWWNVDEDGTLKQGTVSYHVHDIVYIRPDGVKTDAYVIGQITQIHEPKDEDTLPEFDALLYQRYDVIARRANQTKFGNHDYDERRLYQTEQRLKDIQSWKIEGKAYVVHKDSMTAKELEEWLAQSSDHFYVDKMTETAKPPLEALSRLPRRSFKTCKECYEERVEKMKEQRRLHKSRKPLRGLELFAGAGGLSTGFDQSGFVKTEWAVEMEPSAVLSYNENHPHTKVYNGDVNMLLKHAIETSQGKRPKPLTTVEGLAMPPMPKRGEVDFIYGGPPCQGFSGMNHTKTVDDPRNTLACNMLSFVDFYRPSYFLLENVDALLYAKLKAEQEGQKMLGGIKQGMIKLILRSLVKLGYQAHFKVLQAGQYGSPQSRLRVIFWGAKRTLPLPPFPIPTHCTPDDVDKYNLATGQRLWPAVRVRPSLEKDKLLEWLQFAPFLPVTVEDAIGDLPKFDWINPHKVIEMTSEDEAEFQRRLGEGIGRFDAVSNREGGHCGYEREADYGQPRSRYQKWMRAKMGENDSVTYHYTARFGALIVERTCCVPLKKDANHADLPKPLRLSSKFYEPNGASKMSYRSLYSRIDAKGPFSTALTTASPNNKGGKVLHPTQKRILTVREFARSQGFPDHHKFLSRNEAAFVDQYKQIGNAVPVPLALALGKALGGVLLGLWEEEDNNARERSPEVDMDVD